MKDPKEVQTLKISDQFSSDSIDIAAQKPRTKILAVTISESVYTITMHENWGSIPSRKKNDTIQNGRIVTIGCQKWEHPLIMTYVGAITSPTQHPTPNMLFKGLSIGAQFAGQNLIYEKDGIHYSLETSPITNFHIIRPDGSAIYHVEKPAIKIESHIFRNQRQPQDITDKLN